MHYHGWFSDLFMGSLPNQQFGAVSTVDTSAYGNGHIKLGDNFPAPDWNYVDVQMRRNSSSSAAQVIKSGESSESGAFLNQNNTYFDVIALRKALALQKFKEQNARAGWKANAQTKAFFGVDKPKDKDHEIDFLQSYEFPVMVDEVVSQNGATGGNLGDLGGKAIGVGNGRTLKFDSDGRHGYLYCIAYIMPESEYDAVGIDQMLVRSEPLTIIVTCSKILVLLLSQSIILMQRVILPSLTMWLVMLHAIGIIRLVLIRSTVSLLVLQVHFAIGLLHE